MVEPGRGLKEKEEASGQKIIVALDTPSLDVSARMVEDLAGLVSFFKVGFELFTAHGWEAVRQVRKTGARVFLDLKLHDIPNTVSKTVAVLCEHEVDMVTLHALGGKEMMRRASAMVRERIPNPSRRPLLLAVTVLTSHSDEDLSEDLGIRRSLREQVRALADAAQECGMSGVISSPQETAMLREQMPENFLIVTPGVRPHGSPSSDQKRVFAPDEALRAGADYLVIGRPITGAAKPREEALRIIRSMTEV